MQLKLPPHTFNSNRGITRTSTNRKRMKSQKNLISNHLKSAPAALKLLPKSQRDPMKQQLQHQNGHSFTYGQMRFGCVLRGWVPRFRSVLELLRRLHLALTKLDLARGKNVWTFQPQTKNSKSIDCFRIKISLAKNNHP